MAEERKLRSRMRPCGERRMKVGKDVMERLSRVWVLVGEVGGSTAMMRGRLFLLKYATASEAASL